MDERPSRPLPRIVEAEHAEGRLALAIAAREVERMAARKSKREEAEAAPGKRARPAGRAVDLEGVRPGGAGRSGAGGSPAGPDRSPAASRALASLAVMGSTERVRARAADAL